MALSDVEIHRKLIAEEFAKSRPFWGRDRKHYRSILFVETGIFFLFAWQYPAWKPYLPGVLWDVGALILILFFLHKVHTAGEHLLRYEEPRQH